VNSTALLISTLSRATTLGLPASGVMALMLGALTTQGMQPGPEVMTMRPDLFWG
jgi:putative tricarboxylic transport membrane protein